MAMPIYNGINTHTHVIISLDDLELFANQFVILLSLKKKKKTIKIDLLNEVKIFAFIYWMFYLTLCLDATCCEIKCFLKTIL